MDSFSKFAHKSSQNLGNFFGLQMQCIIFNKNGLGYILGDFLPTHLVTLGAIQLVRFT
jgi:hypothetical protein